PLFFMTRPSSDADASRSRAYGEVLHHRGKHFTRLLSKTAFRLDCRAAPLKYISQREGATPRSPVRGEVDVHSCSLSTSRDPAGSKMCSGADRSAEIPLLRSMQVELAPRTP